MISSSYSTKNKQKREFVLWSFMVPISCAVGVLSLVYAAIFHSLGKYYVTAQLSVGVLFLGFGIAGLLFYQTGTTQRRRIRSRSF